MNPNSTFRKWHVRTTKIVIYTGHPENPESKKYQITDIKHIGSLLGNIQLEKLKLFVSHRCGCEGSPHVELHDSNGKFANFSIHHGLGIRCKQLATTDINISQESAKVLIQELAKLGIKEYMNLQIEQKL